MGLVFGVAVGSAHAAASEQDQLNAIAASEGPSGVASSIAHTAQGDTGLVVHALQLTDNYRYGVGSHSVGQAYKWSGSAWQQIGSVDFGVNSPGPVVSEPPAPEQLTGATDFLVDLEAADVPLSAVVSDAGGSWRVVPFVRNGQSQTELTYASVTGNQIKSGANDCQPDCAQGHVTYTTWTYDAASKEFVPGGGSGGHGTGPCHGSLGVGPFKLTATCFKRDGAQWVAHGSISIDGVSVAAQGSTTVTVSPLAESVTATGPVTVSLGSIPIYNGDLNLSLAGSFSIAKKGKVKIKGLPISGNFQLSPTPDGMQVTAFAGVKGFTGNLTLLVDNDGSLDLKKLRLGLGNLPFKQLVIKNASLTYQSVSGGDQWTGDVKVQLPDNLPAIDATLSILNGQLADVGATASGINKPIGEIVFLQSLGLDLGFSPHFTATGSIGLTGGPKLPVVNAAAVGLNATLEADFGWPVVLTATGDITVAGDVQLAQAHAVWTIPNKLSLDGTAGFSLAGASVNFTGSGLVNQKGFGFYGNGALSLPGHSDVKAFGYLSEKGVTSCGIFSAGPLNVLLGFGYRWGDDLPSLWFDSCGALAFKTAAGSSVAHGAGGGTTFDVPRGQRQTLVSATGLGAYPAFSLRSPSGAVISSAGPTDGPIDHGGYLWLQDPDRQATDVVLARPTPGIWTLVPAPGSAPVTSTGVALSAPKLAVVTRVRRRGRHEQLTWRAPNVPGETLAFSEVGARTSAAIANTSKARGSVTFAPSSDGTTSLRRIRVVVEINGLPQAILKGAKFRPPSRGRPGTPRRISLVHRGGRVVVTWSRAAGASDYLVIVHDTNGRRDFFQQAANRRRVTVSPVLAPDRVTATVQAVSAADVGGAAGRGRLTIHRPPHRRPRHKSR